MKSKLRSNQPLVKIREIVSEIENIKTGRCYGHKLTKEYLDLVLADVHKSKKNVDVITTKILNYFILSKTSESYILNDMNKADNKKINVILRTKNEVTKKKRIISLIDGHFKTTWNTILSVYDRDAQEIYKIGMDLKKSLNN